MTADATQLYAFVCRHARQIGLLSSIEAALGWDERTMMPPAAAEYRAEQQALMAGLLHQRAVDPAYGAALAELAASPLGADVSSDSGANIRVLKRHYDKQTKLSTDLVEEMTRTGVLAQHAWEEARRKNDFALFAPLLEKMYALKRTQAERYGFEQNAYDPLLDDYEQGVSTAEVGKVLSGLRDELVPLVAAIAQSGRKADTGILGRSFPVAGQEAFGREVAARIGFDFHRGRLDVTTHPFCTTLGPHDCRITTRYNPRHFNESFFGILHEAGHGMYEQGLPAEHFGLPLGQAVSLGVHESQSRLWENLVGRSRDFWSYFYPEARRRFPEALADVDLEAFYFAINDVRPSFIRVEADEATYNLHILVRFELETALLANDLKVADLPAAWNDCYAKYLGIRPANDAQGVLQDIHWSSGLVGYFPTYTLGNLCAAQLFAKAQRDLGGLSGQIAQGEFTPLRSWLREKVHRHGQRYPASKLIELATGQPLSHRAFVVYLKEKLAPLYGLK